MNLSQSPGPQRLQSLDLFRGITIIAMLLVNNPGNDEATYAPLAHAVWHGCTVADLVFPFFLFIVGVTTQFSLAERRDRGESLTALQRRIVRRSVSLFLLGLLLNWFPFHSLAAIPGIPDPDLLTRIKDSLLHLRLPGVLQRIALCSAVAGTLALATGWRGQCLALGLVLLLGWASLMLVPVPGSGAVGLDAIAEPSATLDAWIDRGLFDWGDWGNHLWADSENWDPEGALSTLRALATVILGLLAGRFQRCRAATHHKSLVLLAAGLTVMAAGQAWALVLPINKALWTGSYALFSGGTAAALLALLMLVSDGHQQGRWAHPLVVFGVNPIMAYALSQILGVVLYDWWMVPLHGEPVGVAEWVCERLLATWLPEKMASLAFAILVVAFFYAVLRRLQRRGILLKL